MGRKIYSAAIKAKAVFDALRGEKKLNEIASAYGVHPTQLSQWKKQAVEDLPGIFSRRRDKAQSDAARRQETGPERR